MPQSVLFVLQDWLQNDQHFGFQRWNPLRKWGESPFIEMFGTINREVKHRGGDVGDTNIRAFRGRQVNRFHRWILWIFVELAASENPLLVQCFLGFYILNPLLGGPGHDFAVVPIK